MKRSAVIVLAIIALFWSVNIAPAESISLYVDSAPNVYGSPSYPAWESNAFALASAGTFVNMANSVNSSNAGTMNFEIQDVVVYSFGDLGRRLHFVYWIPQETITTLAAKHFQISLSYDWENVNYDFYNDYYGSTWLTPTKWIEYAGGVIGSAGFAWWGAYGINTPEALAADLADWDKYQGNITFTARMDDGISSSVTAYHSVPEAASLLLLGLGLLAVAGVGRIAEHA
jgi:hypothetical protein